jgi:hypothetical protein
MIRITGGVRAPNVTDMTYREYGAELRGTARIGLVAQFPTHTVSRESCIWQNENGSCEAGPKLKLLVKFYRSNGPFPIR